MALNMNLQNTIPVQGPQTIGSGVSKKIDKAVEGSEFGDILKTRLGGSESLKQVQNEGLKFSNHAIERMKMRSINLGVDGLKKLGEAVEKARDKNSRETLILMGESAFIVNVKNNTVITAMDREMMRENVFTNIDSTIVV